jgi:ribosomal biogenesis protein LAS1
MSNSLPRLIPFINWDEWLFVKDNLYNEDTNKTKQALEIINMWRIRNRLPHSADSTAQLIEISLSKILIQIITNFFK